MKKLIKFIISIFQLNHNKTKILLYKECKDKLYDKTKLSSTDYDFIKLLLTSDDCYKIGYDIVNNHINRISYFDNEIIEFIIYLLYDNNAEYKEWAKSIVLKYRDKIMNNDKYVVIVGRSKDINVIDYVDIIKKKPGDDIDLYGRCGKTDNIIGEIKMKY